MNTYYIKTFVGALCSLSLLSCSNDLDEKVYSSITEHSYNYSTKDFAPAVARVYSYLRNVADHWGYAA